MTTPGEREAPPGTCLCSHPEGRHGPNAAGPHRGACRAALCGCLWYRPDPDVRAGEAPMSLDDLLEDILPEQPETRRSA